MESNVIVTCSNTDSPKKSPRELKMEKILGDLVNLRLYKIGRESIQMNGLYVYGWNEEFYKQNKIRLWAEAEAILETK